MKECSFCEDARFARTGVCISCDAGMCRSYFHVTCAQREGLLSEAAAEEVRGATWILDIKWHINILHSYQIVRSYKAWTNWRKWPVL